MMRPRTINVDYHFHPNLPRSDSRARRKVRRIFWEFARNRIDAVIVTEHAYKDYRRAWEYMREYAPPNITVFPGMEYITAEGIDICMFARTEEVYAHRLIPFALTFEEVIAFLREHPDVYGFVTHPFTLGTTSVINKKGHHFTRHAIDEIGAVEASYTVYAELEVLMSLFGLNHVLPAIHERLGHNEELPRDLLPAETRFLAAGSDAHFPSHIGTCAVVPVQEDDFFYSITHNTSLTVSGDRDLNLFHLLLSAQITFEEWAQKRLYRWRSRLLRRSA